MPITSDKGEKRWHQRVILGDREREQGASAYEPKIVRKRQRRFEGFGDKILALYSRGIWTRDIEAHLQEIYGVHVGRDLISRVTGAVMDDARAWAQRPLEDVYPVVSLDCMVLKIREAERSGAARATSRSALRVDGDRDALGMWFQESQGEKFWMQVLADLKQRGVSEILICCVVGLKGFPEAIEAIFLKTTVQTCIVHLIRHSLKYVPRRERERVARDLKPIYTAADAAQAELERFNETWGARFPDRHSRRVVRRDATDLPATSQPRVALRPARRRRRPEQRPPTTWCFSRRDPPDAEPQRNLEYRVRVRTGV